MSLFVLYILLGRDALAEFASGDAVRFYYLHSPVLDERHYIGLEEWRAAWSRWMPQSKELVLLVLFLVALVVPGYYLGSRRTSLVLSSVVLIAVCVLLPPVFGLVLWDYDVFLGGVFFDVLSLDLIPVFWWYVDKFSIVYFALATAFYSYIHVFCNLIATHRVDQDPMQSPT